MQRQTFIRLFEATLAIWLLIALLVAISSGRWVALIALPAAALLAMTVTALMVRESRWLGIGGLLFLVSDSLIGINRFIATFPASTAIIVSIYVASIVLIARGVFGLPPARRS